MLALALLLLPGPASAATITVNSVLDTAADTGFCTLREAIIAANMNTASGATAGECAAGAAGADTIAFNIATGCNAVTGVCTIQPGSALPTVTEPVTINGYTQSGAVMNSLAVGSNAALKIEIDGINAGLLTNGLITITAGSSTVRGLVINRAQGGGSAGLLLSVLGGNTVAGNFIGIDPTGTIPRGNGCQGLFINLSSGNTIGGLSPADRNVIAATQGCGGNLSINSSSTNQILNNYIGTNAAGTASLFGNAGVVIGSFGGSSTGNIIGGTTAAARNVLSGNSEAGVLVFDATTTGNIVQGNFIGTDATGTLPVPNVHGVEFIASPAQDNLVGGTTAGSGNRIAFNTGDGVSLSGSPLITGIAILGNSIFSNGNLGIDLNNDGVTANDLDDPDTGPNDLQNFPEITSVMTGGGSTTIQGSLNSTPSHDFLIEFFSSPSCDTSGNGEGQTFLQSTTVATDVNGDHTINFAFGSEVTPGHAITATATDLGPTPPIKSKRSSRGVLPRSAQGGILVSPGPTSEFSACFIVGGVTPTPTPTATPTVPGPTSTPTPTPSMTPTPTSTPTSTPTVTPGGPTATPTPTPSLTPTPTSTPTSTQTVTPGGPTFTPTPTPSLTPTPTSTPTSTQTVTPGGPTFTPTPTPSLTPTPTATPTTPPGATATPTPTPSSTPTSTPTLVPPTATATATVTGAGGPGAPPSNIPTLSGAMLALLGLALAAIGFLLTRRA